MKLLSTMIKKKKNETKQNISTFYTYSLIK